MDVTGTGKKAVEMRKFGMYMGLPVKPVTILVSLGIIAVAYVLGLCLAGRKLKKIDMVEGLKCSLE